ncbi:sensor domain-containing diguanylate cyclase [Aquabacterium sp. A7-Y]|uniref:sensor domain-containing diguanylate cyclase n=1 Tax=Aquabacterium sp. A7-Y TaxID=1349605 RepID=UPI00223E5C1E|nr:sensor domain-containing diguanylate cyclase [Aquabacterium sp. A7-Y]MCW7537564.1 sensor domain-containing diguanylate cyclase [Aquabacterium sp. A7-Y]
MLLAATEHSQCGVWAKDGEGRYVWANPATARLLGREPAELLGRSDDELLPPEWAAPLKAADQTAMGQINPSYRDDKLPGLPGGAPLELLALRLPVQHGPDASDRCLCGVWTEVSEQRRAQAQLRLALDQLEAQQRQNEELRQELRDQSVRDPVTGVYNRRHFEEQLHREIDLSMREHREFALVSVQVDAYAALTSQHGREAAERTLQALGRLLRSNTRVMDAPCRLGEDRFAVVLSGVGLATAHSRMESVRRQCEAQLVMLEGAELHFTVSMGVASFPHTAYDREGLLRSADAALEEAKRRGSNCVMLAAIPFGPAAPPV